MKTSRKMKSDPQDDLDQVREHFRTLRTFAAMLSACQELQGSVVVEAELIGEIGGLFMDELLEMESALERLGAGGNR